MHFYFKYNSNIPSQEDFLLGFQPIVLYTERKKDVEMDVN